MRTGVHLLPKSLRTMTTFHDSVSNRVLTGACAEDRSRGKRPSIRVPRARLSGAGAGARARAAASRARRAPVWRAAGGSEVVGCGVCAASAVAGAAARRAGGSAGLAVSRNRASSGHCPSPSHTPCRLGPARAGPGGAGYREYGKHGGGGSGRARAGSAALCAAPGRAARGAGAPLCPRRAGGRGGKVAGRQGRWPSLTGRSFSCRKT